MKIYLLFGMLFLHIVDDYYLQGWLASAKQKSWWEKNYPDKLYSKDYLMALFEHAFSWTFMIMLIPAIYTYITSVQISPTLLISFIVNLAIHCKVDDLKANNKKINLIQDQLWHFAQIGGTWLLFIELN